MTKRVYFDAKRAAVRKHVRSSAVISSEKNCSIMKLAVIPKQTLTLGKCNKKGRTT